MALRVAEIQAGAERAMWDHYVMNHPMASGYHSLACQHVVQQAFGYRAVYRMLRDEDNKVQGGLPLILISSRSHA